MTMLTRRIEPPPCLFNFTNYAIGFVFSINEKKELNILGPGLVYHFPRTAELGAPTKLRALIKGYGKKIWHQWEIKDGISYSFKEKNIVTDLYVAK